jgi:hypothetical protein
MRCQILGLNAPTTLNINWKKDAEAMGVNPEQMKDMLVRQMVEKAKGAIRDGKDLAMIIPAEGTEDAEWSDGSRGAERAVDGDRQGDGVVDG